MTNTGLLSVTFISLNRNATAQAHASGSVVVGKLFIPRHGFNGDYLYRIFQLYFIFYYCYIAAILMGMKPSFQSV